MITGKTITDNQLLALRASNGGSTEVVDTCNEAMIVAGDNGGLAIRRAMARSRAAEILNARSEVCS